MNSMTSLNVIKIAVHKFAVFFIRAAFRCAWYISTYVPACSSTSGMLARASYTLLCIPLMFRVALGNQ
jgi:hypothetical protein